MKRNYLILFLTFVCLIGFAQKSTKKKGYLSEYAEGC